MEVVDDMPKSKKPRLSPSADHAAGGPDLISSLSDDVLLHILELVSNARDLVRTGGLSRRWRGLWTEAPVLHFYSPPEEFKSAGDAERYVAFVSNVLALRAQSTTTNSLEDLGISYRVDCPRRDDGRVVPLSIKAAQDWVRDAVQHQVKSFRLYLSLHGGYDDDEYGFYDGYSDDDEGKDDLYNEGKHVIDLGKLPRSAEKLETMVLSLVGQGVRLRLPSDVVFSSLTDLRLQQITVARGSEQRFFRFLSKGCSPRLKKLYMSGIEICGGCKKLVLEADELSELTLSFVRESTFLELKAPSLRVLRIEECELGLWILAPRLEEFAFMSNFFTTTDTVEGEYFSSVKRLELQLDWYRHSDGNDIRAFWLQHCTSATSLDVSLEPKMNWDRQSTTLDIFEGSATKLPHFTSLVVRPGLKWLAMGDVAIFFSRFSFTNLRFLELHLENSKDDPYYTSSDGPDDWKSYEISFAHLEEAAFTGLTGTDGEFRFLQHVLTSANGLRKLTASYSTKRFQEEGMRDYVELKLLSLVGSGSWSACRDCKPSYRWRSCR